MITETNQILIFLLWITDNGIEVLVRFAVASLVIYNLIDILYAKRPHPFINSINIIPILLKVFLSCFFLFYAEITKENTSWCMLQSTVKDLEMSFEI